MQFCLSGSALAPAANNWKLTVADTIGSLDVQGRHKTPWFIEVFAGPPGKGNRRAMVSRAPCRRGTRPPGPAGQSPCGPTGCRYEATLGQAGRPAGRHCGISAAKRDTWATAPRAMPSAAPLSAIKRLGRSRPCGVRRFMAAGCRPVVYGPPSSFDGDGDTDGWNNSHCAASGRH